MGATIPLAMLAIRKRWATAGVGAIVQLSVPGQRAGRGHRRDCLALLLIELYGFRGTLKIGAALNGVLALSAMLLSMRAVRTRR